MNLKTNGKMKLKLNGVDIHYEFNTAAGQAAPVLLFAHCLGGDLSIWRAQLDHYAGRYRTLAYDLRGQGRSGVTPPPYAMPMLAADALGLLDALGIDAVVFFGVSMGGMVAQQAALAAPSRVRALVLADTAAGFAAEGRAAWAERIDAVARDGVAPLVPTMMERWFTEALRLDAPQRVAAVAAVLAATPSAGYLGACAAIRDFDVRERLSEIACPTLVICGADDPSTPPALSEQIAAGIRGAELSLLPGARHLPNFEVPARFNALTDAFLATLDRRAA